LSYQFVCEPCPAVLGLDAPRPYLNKLRRQAKAAVTPEILKRDSTGKPVLIGNQRLGYFEMTPAGCSCACVSNGHDPGVCTGQQQFKIGGRPGSGFVDQLAKELGREPIPEQVVARHEDCYVLVVATLAWWFSSSNEEKLVREAELENYRYDDLIALLCDVLLEQRPDLMSAAPYSHLKTNLTKLTKFRNKVAHSRPRGADYFSRIKRVKGIDVEVHVTQEELAEYLDLSIALQSQLSFIPIYLAQET
jgi:hypothetical protein